MPGLITDVLAQGVHASRPAVPDASSSTLSLWFSTDTEALYLYDWNDAAWQTIPLTAGAGDLLAANNLSDLSNVLTAAENLGVGVTDSPQFAGINIGHASDTTLTRTGAGDIAVEGNAVYRAGGTDVPVTDGGTGASTAAAAATNLGVGTGDSPQFTAVNIGHATDTTLTRTGAGDIAVEGNAVYRAGGTDVALADGGTGATLADPGADRIMFWDDSAGAVDWLTAGTNLTITGTTIAATAGYEGGPPTPPTTADLATWLNQDTSTVTDGTGAMVLKPDPNTQYHSRVKTVPATPYSIYCRVEVQTLSTAAVTTAVTAAAGVVLRDSADSEIVAFVIGHDRVAGDEQNTYSAAITRWTADGGTNSATPQTKYTGQMWKWIKVDDDGTTFTFSVGMDGKNWLTVGTETRAAFIDTVTEYGVTAVATPNATEAAAIFSYFSTTAPV